MPKNICGSSDTSVELLEVDDVSRASDEASHRVVGFGHLMSSGPGAIEQPVGAFELMPQLDLHESIVWAVPSRLLAWPTFAQTQPRL